MQQNLKTVELSQYLSAADELIEEARLAGVRPRPVLRRGAQAHERVRMECRLRTAHDSEIAIYVPFRTPSHDLRFDRLHNELIARCKRPQIAS
jgi:hypothetical protein